MRLPSCRYWAMDLTMVSKKNQEYCGREIQGWLALDSQYPNDQPVWERTVICGCSGGKNDLKWQNNKTKDVQNKQWHVEVNRKRSKEEILHYSLQVHPLLVNNDTTAEYILASADRSKSDNPP